MRILVPVKRVLDFALKPRINAERTAVDLSNLKMSINPFCEIAVEEAVRMKEQNHAKEVIAVSIGPKQCQETLRTALAMGADRAIHVQSELRTDQDLQPLAVSKILAHLAKTESIDLVIQGKQSIDDDSNQTSQMLAGLLNWPQATFLSKISLGDNAKTITATREVDGGLQTVSFSLPAVITCDLRLNQPRYSSLPNIMKARKKPLQTMEASELGIDIQPKLETLSVNNPPQRKSGVIVESVKELVQKLKADGVLS